QDVVDLGVVAVVVGPGVGLDLDAVHAGRGARDVPERPPSPAARAAHRVDRAEVGHRGLGRTDGVRTHDLTLLSRMRLAVFRYPGPPGPEPAPTGPRSTEDGLCAVPFGMPNQA